LGCESLGGGAFKQPRDPWQSLSDEALVKTKRGFQTPATALSQRRSISYAGPFRNIMALKASRHSQMQVSANQEGHSNQIRSQLYKLPRSAQAPKGPRGLDSVMQTNAISLLGGEYRATLLGASKSDNLQPAQAPARNDWPIKITFDAAPPNGDPDLPGPVRLRTWAHQLS
jgi:hypothetical protein